VVILFGAEVSEGGSSGIVESIVAPWVEASSGQRTASGVALE